MCDNGRLHNVSLGQGQERVAEQALREASVGGHWVILQVGRGEAGAEGGVRGGALGHTAGGEDGSWR